MISWAGVLSIVFWGIVGLMLVVLAAVARFYQITSGQNTHYRWFALPVFLFVASAVRYSLMGDFTGDLLGDLFIAAGAASLAALAARLVSMMTGGRR